ncbi:hypothetical protein H8B02_29200 [Bradyrhizobium sp. Pear77]|uniref:hypothetical protein n=1 Tax=Bradyrhizobium altum TaxID=1571202 RepID=UPI001E31EAC3|nr:hypothetical protein [Bradyrhizobium altum]MCC8957367.1 hypothetical protein [Bradyrhizobium altum]
MAALMAFLQATVADFSEWVHPSKKQDVSPAENVPTVGKYRIDYSEPSQAQIDAANAECADLFKSGEWISVNRKS